MEYGSNEITDFAHILLIDLSIFLPYNKTLPDWKKNPNKNKVTVIWKLARLKGHPVDD